MVRMKNVVTHAYTIFVLPQEPLPEVCRGNARGRARIGSKKAKRKIIVVMKIMGKKGSKMRVRKERGR